MSRLTLQDRIVIECGIYQKLSLCEIAKKIGKSPESISREIRANRTIAPGEHFFGKDCHYAGECKTKGLCGKDGCSRRCVACREYDCRELCTRYNNTPCVVLSKPPYVCNVCVRRRKCKADRAYYIAGQADAMAKALKVNSHMLWIQMETLYSAKDIIPITVQSGLLTQHLSAEKIQKCNVLELLSLQKAGFLVLMIAAVTLDLTQNHLRRLIASLINFINEIQICLTSVLNGGNEYEK